MDHNQISSKQEMHICVRQSLSQSSRARTSCQFVALLFVLASHGGRQWREKQAWSRHDERVAEFMDKLIQDLAVSVSAASSTPASGGAGRLFDLMRDMRPDPQEEAVSHRSVHHRSLHGISNDTDDLVVLWATHPWERDARLAHHVLHQQHQHPPAGGGRGAGCRREEHREAGGERRGAGRHRGQGARTL